MISQIQTTQSRLDAAYQAGRDYAQNGATDENCNADLFLGPKFTRAWEQGCDEERARQKAQEIW